MIRVANYNRLSIARATDNGLYLTDGEGNEVLLPNRYVPEKYAIGDPMEVFVYTDSEDRQVAGGRISVETGSLYILWDAGG